MRCGRLLAEDSPESLLRAHNALSLEQVFLNLCQVDSADADADADADANADADAPADSNGRLLIVWFAMV